MTTVYRVRRRIQIGERRFSVGVGVSEADVGESLPVLLARGDLEVIEPDARASSALETSETRRPARGHALFDPPSADRSCAPIGGNEQTVETKRCSSKRASAPKAREGR